MNWECSGWQVGAWVCVHGDRGSTIPNTTFGNLWGRQDWGFVNQILGVTQSLVVRGWLSSKLHTWEMFWRWKRIPS